MARKPGAKAPYAPFGALLDKHLRAGQRADANNREPWTNAAFAKAIPGRDADSVGASDRSVANWRKGTALPNAITPIIVAMFGGFRTDASAELRAAYDAALLLRQRGELEAATNPAGVSYAEGATSLSIIEGFASDVDAAADLAVMQRHPNLIEKLRDLRETVGSRLDNQRAWRVMPRKIEAALVAADRPTSELPAHLVALYDNLVSLGGFVGQDDAIGANRAASDDPLDADIRRALVDALTTGAPWARSFPSVLKWDNESRDFLTRPELFEPIRNARAAARDFLRLGSETGALSPADADAARLPLETAEGVGVQAEKAAVRGVANARNLLTKAAAVLAAFLSGATASDYATRSELVKNLGALLANGENLASDLIATAPDDLRAAVANVLAELRKHGLDAAGDAPPASRPNTVEAPPPWPPRTHLAWWREVRENPPAWCPTMITLAPPPPGDRFLMGAPKAEKGSDDERPQREVTVRPFALGRCAVTFAEWDAALKTGAKLRNPGDEEWDRKARPVINVSWEDAQAYCVWLNEALGLPAGTYRLPSEAEWEFACRAGAPTPTPYSFGATISPKQANFRPDRKEEFRNRTVAVGTLPANDWGLHEMHGNVWEWVEDAYGPYPDHPTDSAPLRHPDSGRRVLRGGSWGGYPGVLRSAIRFRFTPDSRSSRAGFRLARTLF